MSCGGAFESLFCPGGSIFVHNDCPDGRVLLSSHFLGGFILGRWLMMKVIGALVRDFMVMSSSRVLSGILCWGGGEFLSHASASKHFF